MSSSEFFVYACIDWFSTVDDVEDIKDLPQIFEKLAAINDISDEDLSIVNQYLKCRFVSENFSGWDDFIEDDNDGEFESDETNIVGLDFTARNIPSTRAEANLEVKLRKGVSTADFEAWIDESGSLLSDGVIFYWDFASIEKLEDLDFTQEEHLGLEAVVQIKKINFNNPEN